MRRALRGAHFIFFILFCMALANITQALEIDVGHLSTHQTEEAQGDPTSDDYVPYVLWPDFGSRIHRPRT